MQKEKLRCFISVEIPEEIKNKIVKVQEKLPEFFGKKTEYENLHLTLKFLGELDIGGVEEVRKRLRGVKFSGFNVEIKEIGFFSKDFIRIIWLGLNGCEELQSKVDDSISDLFDPEERFMGHLTIARVKNVGDKKKFIEELEKINFEKMNFNVKDFYLMSSVLSENGPKYSVIEKYK